MSQCFPCHIFSYHGRPIRILPFLAPAVPIGWPIVRISRRQFSSRESADFVPSPGRANCFLRANARKQHRPRIDVGPSLRGFGVGLFRRSCSESETSGQQKSWKSVQVDLKCKWRLMSSLSNLLDQHTQGNPRRFLGLVSTEGRNAMAIERAWQNLPKANQLAFVESVGNYLEHNSYWNMLSRLMEWYCTSVGTRSKDLSEVSQYFNAIVAGQIPTEKSERISQECRRRRADKVIKLLRSLLLLKQNYKGRNLIKQRILHKLIVNASPESLVGFYGEIRESNHGIGRYTTLHLITRLSDLRTWGEAYSILQAFNFGHGGELMMSKAWYVFLKMFYQATYVGQEECNGVIRKMLDAGISPTTETYNIVMSKAVREGNEDTMKQAFQEMLESGLTPSMVTFGILHKHYKLVGKEEEQIMVIRDAMMLDRRLNVVLASDIVHAKVLASSSYTEVYMQFTKLFKPGALSALGLTGGTRYSLTEKLEPNHFTIAVMTYAFCREDRGLRVAWKMYRRYQGVLAERANPYQAVLASAGSFIPNSFMLALGSHQTGLNYCATILEDMLQESSPIRPDVVSWSILLQAIVKRGLMEEAEQVIDLMRAKGTEPNSITWTSLLNGYMKQHDLFRTGQVIAHMSKMGLKPDRATIDRLTAYLDCQELLDGIRDVERNKKAEEGAS